MSDWDNLLDDRSSRDGEDTDCRGVGDQVLEHHRAEVLAFFRRQRSLRPEDARDMAQETLFRALRRGRLDTVRNVRAYLLQVARNLFRERGRRGRLVRFVPLEEIDSGQIRDVAPSPEAVAIGREQLAAVLDAVDRLPRRARQAVILHKFHHLSYAQVAAVMGISPRTVEKHLAKGVDACTQALEPIEVQPAETVVAIAAAAGRVATDDPTGSEE